MADTMDMDDLLDDMDLPGTETKSDASARAEAAAAASMVASMDANGDGALDRAEVKGLMKKDGVNLSEAQADALMKEADKDGDGKLSAEELAGSKLMQLHAAITKSDVQAVITLLYSYDMNLSEVNADGQTLLHKACQQGNTMAAAMLLEKDKKMLTLLIKDKSGHTALELAIQNKHKACSYLLAKKVLEKGGMIKPATPGTDPAPDSARSNIIQAIITNDQNAVITQLYSLKLDLTEADSKGTTLLHHAAGVGNTLVVALMLEKDRKMTALLLQNADGQTPLEIAIKEEHAECAYVLAKKVFEVQGSKACVIM